MIKYSINVLSCLKDAGYTQIRIRNEKLIGQRTLSQLRAKELVSWKTIDTICSLLNCQPGDFLEWVPDPVANGAPAAGADLVLSPGGNNDTHF